MNRIHIDADRALQLLREVVAEKGEGTVYRQPDGHSCVYVFKGECSCLVGHALHRAGVPIERLAELGDLIILFAGKVLDGVDIEREAITVFYAAQGAQDAHQTWGEALARAQDAHPFDALEDTEVDR